MQAIETSCLQAFVSHAKVSTIERVILMTEPSELVNRTRFSNALRNDLLKGLNELNAETKIPKSLLLDEAIELLLEKYNRNNTAR